MLHQLAAVRRRESELVLERDPKTIECLLLGRAPSVTSQLTLSSS